jgi:hypothetical protein
MKLANGESIMSAPVFGEDASPPDLLEITASVIPAQPGQEALLVSVGPQDDDLQGRPAQVWIKR